MIYERRHTRLISEFGGIARSMPIFAIFFMIVTLSSIGLPGLNGFVGEFLILLGSFKKSVLLTVLAASGVILAAVYMLWMFKRAMFRAAHQGGKQVPEGSQFPGDRNPDPSGGAHRLDRDLPGDLLAENGHFRRCFPGAHCRSPAGRSAVVESLTVVDETLELIEEDDGHRR